MNLFTEQFFGSWLIVGLVLALLVGDWLLSKLGSRDG